MGKSCLDSTPIQRGFPTRGQRGYPGYNNHRGDFQGRGHGGPPTRGKGAPFFSGRGKGQYPQENGEGGGDRDTPQTIWGGSKKRKPRGCRGRKRKKKARDLMQGIFNLSDTTFTGDELKVLELGLKYAPDKNLNRFYVFIDLQKFMRKCNIKKAFQQVQLSFSTGAFLL